MKHWKKILLIAGLLALAAALIAGVIFNAEFSDGFQAFAAFLAAVLAAVSVGVAITLYRDGVREKAIGLTTGVVCRARESASGGDGADLPSRFWVRYRVDGVQYQRKVTSGLEHQKDMDRFLNMKVTVHYDPERPKRSWVEIPGGQVHW